jgi:Transglutaminase-like superfamily
MEYFIGPQVFLCRSSRYVVILDVRRDRYCSVLREQFELLAPWLNGWTDAYSPDRPDHPTDAAAEVARVLLSQGILTPDPTGAKPVRPITIPAPKSRVTLDRRPSHAVLFAKTAAFFLACRRADTALQRIRLETVVAHVASRRLPGGRPQLVTTASKARATYLTAVFDALRLFYPRPYLCTFDSLALLEFLASEGVHPRWIFAVRAEPFHAHCWVQCGETLLNDRIERVSRFTPIMAV